MKQITQIPDYFVCEGGHVYNKHGKALKTQLSRDGYRMVSIWQKGCGKSRTYSVHRLVAIAYIPNPHNYPCVNHIDGDKQNNEVSNLEWCTYSENSKPLIVTGKQIGRAHV